MGNRDASSGSRFEARAHTFSAIAAVYVALVGMLILGGWAFQLPRLQHFVGPFSTKANPPIALALAGISLLLLHRGQGRRPVTIIREILATAVFLIGAITLGEHFGGWYAGIDQLFFRELPGVAGTTSSGRVGPPAAFCFTASGISLLLLSRNQHPKIAQMLAILVLGWSLLAITGYAYKSEELNGISHFTAIALPTAIAFFVLSLGLLCFRIGTGFTALLASNFAGGAMARRLLFAATTIPFLLGWLQLETQRARYYDLGFGTGILVLIIITTFALLIWETASKINLADQRQLRSQRLLSEGERQLEEQRQLLDLSREPILAWEFDGGIVAWNRGCEELYGVKREDALGKTSHDLLGTKFPESRAVYLEELRQREQWQGELRQLSSDGREVIVESHQQLIESQGGIVVLESNRGISERKHAEKEREKLLRSEQGARAQAEVANRLKDEFLATVSHELRTPLNAMLGWVTLLRTGDLSPGESRQAFEVIERNARAQARLVDDLLDVSRIVSGQLRLDLQPLNMAEIVASAIEAVQPAATAKEIRIVSTLDDKATAIAGDPTRFQQVVWNLLSNAVKFTPKDGVVEVRVSRVHSRAQLVVHDTGEGISSDFLPYVFERFQQADGSKTRRHGGLGLGLAIARHLVEMHGGTIAAISPGRGHGATFTIEIPIMAPRLAPLEPAQEFIPARSTVQNSPALVRGKFKGLRVLIVDDEPDARRMLREVLKRMGAEVMSAPSCAEALARFAEARPELVVCDLGMPEEDGYMFIKRLRARAAEDSRLTPAIAFTGYAHADERRKALAAGFDAMVTKPLRASILADTMTTLLGNRSADGAAVPARKN